MRTVSACVGVSGGAFVSHLHIPVLGPCGKRSWAQDSQLYFDAIGTVFSVWTVIGAAVQPGTMILIFVLSDAHAIGRYGRSLRIPQIGAVPPNETVEVLFHSLQ